MKADIKTITAIAAALLALPAAAQDAGFYLGAPVGQSKAGDSCSGMPSGVSCDDKATTWKLIGGYQFNRYIGAELQGAAALRIRRRFASRADADARARHEHVVVADVDRRAGGSAADDEKRCTADKSARHGARMFAPFQTSPRDDVDERRRARGIRHAAASPCPGTRAHVMGMTRLVPSAEWWCADKQRVSLLEGRLLAQPVQ